MKADRHHPVRRVERLFNAIAMMDIDVNVEDTLVIAKEFENAKDDIWMVGNKRTD